MKKLYNFQKKVLNKIGSLPKKTIAVVLVIAVLISTVNLIAAFANNTVNPAVNYPALEEFTEGSAPSANGVWSYNVRDFAEKAVFEISTGDFEAPLGVWNANDSYATVTWDSITDADEYILNIYEDIQKIHSLTLNTTSWQSSATEQIEGGKTYQMQVIATKGGEKIAASDIRSFKAQQAEIITPYVLNNFSSSEDLDKVRTPLFSSKKIEDNKLVLQTATNRKNSRIYVDKDAITFANAEAIMFYIKPESEMLQAFRWEFGSGSTYKESGEATDIYYVSAANPNNTTVFSTSNSKSISTTDTTYSAYCQDGYYVIIPFSLYDTSISEAIANGTYDVCTLLIQNIQYKDAVTGEFAKAGNFDGSNIIFDDFCLINDIDGYLKQIRQDYNKVHDVDKYNEILKEELKATAYAYTGGVSLLGEALKADKFSSNSLTNDEADTGYKLSNNKDSRKIVFEATSKATFNYGSHMKFTAPEDAVYDLGGAINVQGNTTVTDAVVKYRLIKIDSNQNETVITGDGDWLEMAVNEDNKNPSAKFPVTQVALKAGEAVAIEVYQDSSQDDTVLSISLGNPTATVVTGVSSYSGTSTTYTYSDYNDAAIFDSEGSNIGKHSPIDNRWNTYTFKKTSSGVEYSPINSMRKTWTLLYNNSINGVGYNYKSNNIQTKIVDAGVSLEFIAAQTGNATINLPIKACSDGMFLRILKNGTKVYPANNDWEAISTSASTVQAAVDVQNGDSISIEVYGGVSGTLLCEFESSPSITIADQKDANNLDSKTFSPLWERPYKGSSYVGDCVIPNGSVWEYEFFDVSDQSVIKADYYDSYKKMLYVKNNDEIGYIFENESLNFAFGNSSKGMQLTFNVPSRTYYDLSSAFKLLSGTGKVKVRILKNDEIVYPYDSEWVEFTEELAFNAIEIGANSGDKLIIQAYVENGSNAVISMGTPVIQRLTNRQYTEIGNITVYKPEDYTAFENGYDGDFIQLNSRFTYSFNDGASVPVKSNSSDAKLLNQNSYFAFKDNGAVEILTDAANTAEIKYKSVMNGNGNISMTNSNGAEYRVLKNSDIVADWSTEDNLNKEIELAKDDVITIQFKGTGNAITVSGINVSMIGQHNNTNSAEDDGFFANYADPYSDEYHHEDYNGAYKKTDTEYWNFDFYNSEKDEIKPANAYSTTENKKLYRTQFDNTGYYFGASHLTADLNVKDGYGIALGFTSPRADTFNSRYGLRLVTENEEAVIKVRIRKTAADSGKISQVWPNDTEWYEATVKSGEDITIPYAELSLKKGDTVYLEVYAVSANADKITVNLVSPAFIKETVEVLDYTDIKAKIYNAYSYGPYNYIKNYNGTYVPMDNRWNFYLADVTNAGETLSLFEPDTIRTDTSSEHSFYSSLNNIPQFIWKTSTKTVDVRSYVAKDKNVGAVMSYACPYSGNIRFTATPVISEIAVQNASLKYRIIRKSINDGSISTVWPNDETSKWEVLNTTTQSNCIDLELEVELGDILEFQYYWDAPQDKLDAYLTANSLTYWNPEFTVAPSIIATEWINTQRTSFDAVSQFISDYLINPYWRVQYKLNDSDTEWKHATEYKGIYWQLPSPISMVGISKRGLYAIEHYDNSLENYNPTLAWKFTSRSEGKLTMSGTKILSVAKTSTAGYNALIRITVNEQQVYPEVGWTEISYGNNVKLTDVSFEVKEGDEIRFEAKSSKPLANGDLLRLSWTPAFTISDEVNIYSETDDIFNMLDAQMYEVFTAMDGKEEFDQGLEKNKLLSQQIKDWLASIKPFNYFAVVKKDDSKQDVDNSYVEDTYREWTEEIYTPGGSWKKIIRYTSTDWWIYALIAVGAVVALGGITTTVIILVKKRKNKLANK